MYGISGKQPFDVLVRQENSGGVRLVIKFECREGMGVLGIRKVDRVDPAPSGVYQESDIEPESLKAGRFVHVLGSGQRQSYALSRLSPDIAARLPTDAWVELKPHSEYGFRYLVVPEESLQPATAAVAAVAAVGKPAPVALPKGAPAPTTAPATQSAPATATGAAPAPAAPASGASSQVPKQVPMAPALAESALAGLTKDTAIQHLRGEMAKVSALHAEVQRLQTELEKSHARETDLIGMLSRWRQA